MNDHNKHTLQKSNTREARRTDWVNLACDLNEFNGVAGDEWSVASG
jgi:hypothetical protein